MAFHTAELGPYKLAYDLTCQFRAHDASPYAEHVHVIVLDALMSGVGVMAQSSSNPRKLVGRHRHPYTAAADDDSSLRVASPHRFAGELGVIGVIDRLRRIVRTQVDSLVAPPTQVFNEDLLQAIPRVVCSEDDLHGLTVSWTRWCR